jgi:hypothetical protein
MRATFTANCKKSLWALSVLTLSCGLPGCGSGTVSESSARTAYEKSTEAIAEGKAKLISFRKINARKSEVFGMKFYEVEYEAEVEFLEDFPPVRYTTFPSMLPGGKPSKQEVPDFFMGLKGKKGEVKKQRGWLSFEQTEKGWRGPDKNVY